MKIIDVKFLKNYLIQFEIQPITKQRDRNMTRFDKLKKYQGNP